MALNPVIETRRGFTSRSDLFQYRFQARGSQATVARECLQDAPALNEGKASQPRVSCQGINVTYRGSRVLHNVHLDVGQNEVLALIGASGCGKSTFLRCLNRMNDTLPECRVEGKILLNAQDVYAPEVDAVGLRAQVGMIFQKPNPYPQSVYDNIAYGLRIHGLSTCASHEHALVENALRQAGVWKEVMDRLHQPAYRLSAGQQQRLCIARALAVNPFVILMDEPCSALDPVSTAIVERLIEELREKYSIILATHSLQQAARVSQRTAFFDRGRLIEVGPTAQIFTTPKETLTDAYISGRTG